MYHTCIYQCICLLSEILLLAVFYRLEEGGILTDCSIQTQEPDETLDFDFSGADVLNKIIMKVRRDNISYTESFLKQLTGPFCSVESLFQFEVCLPLACQKQLCTALA